MAMDQQKAVLADLEQAYKATLPTVTEDSMAGELSNCIMESYLSGRKKKAYIA